MNNTKGYVQSRRTIKCAIAKQSSLQSGIEVQYLHIYHANEKASKLVQQILEFAPRIASVDGFDSILYIETLRSIL
jgi:hypothetical protein